MKKLILLLFCIFLGGIIMAKQKEFPRFVVHKHDASHLHYDLRLEIHDALVSWAVPKGIPKKINEKHLAIKQPDHPFSYIDFEGEIEKGYGAGTVEIWDEGYFSSFVETPADKETLEESLKNGKLELEFFGEKLKGNYALIKSHFKGKSQQDTWLLFKTSKKSNNKKIKQGKKIYKKAVRQRKSKK
jgi:bifunctional non-homologous end joining protein LigD